MTESHEEQEAQQQAKQDVVDRVASWQHGAEKETVRDELDKGFKESEVEVSEDQTESIAEEIHETDGNPKI